MLWNNFMILSYPFPNVLWTNKSESRNIAKFLMSISNAISKSRMQASYSVILLVQVNFSLDIVG